MTTWARDAIGYHFFPLGVLGAPHRNDFRSGPVARLRDLMGWTDHLRSLGVTTVLLGPVWESTSHGYDTADLFAVDRRLGTDDDLRAVVDHFHAHGIRVLLDAVYHHVGRDHAAFRDLVANGEGSAHRHWFHGVNFGRRSPLGDPFDYHGWNGTHDLVKLDVGQPAVRDHLFAATRHWFDRFGIDGLRLDAADVLDRDFQRDLAAHVRSFAPDAYLMGEVIHGDYRDWAGPGRLDATTDYVAWKGLHSAFNDANLHEIGWTLDQHYGPAGHYRDLPLATFLDNHDVARIASTVREPAHLYPLHVLLLTMPGVPFLYYGSEWGIAGDKGHGDDWGLRPALPSPPDPAMAPQPCLADTIARLARIRHETPALRHGGYRQLHVGPEQLAFAREADGQRAVVAINAAAAPAELVVSLDVPDGTVLVDALDPACRAEVRGGRLTVPAVPPRWGRILVTA